MRPRLIFIIESGSDVRLVEGLAERFHLSILARRIQGGVEISQTPSVSVPTTIGPASRVSFAWTIWKTLWRRCREVDCVIVQGYGMAALAANFAGRLLSVPVFMLVCSPIEKYYLCRRAYPAPDKPFRRRELWGIGALARVNARAGRQYIVLSEHLSEVVRGHGTRRPVLIVPVYGVDTGVFSPARESKRAAKERLGLPMSGSLIFFSSRVAPEKDTETLLMAVRGLLDKGHDLWLLHRSGGYRAFIEDAKRFGLAERVIATDAVHPHRQLPDDYRASDLCVQASREEGLGFSPLEALACGTPVVAASVGGLRETIIHGRTGWSYSAGDAEALAGCIESALSDKAEATRRATAGREMVCARYEQRVVFERLAETLNAQRRRSENKSSAKLDEQSAADNQRRALREEADPL